jgi:hypothetical protein
MSLGQSKTLLMEGIAQVHRWSIDEVLALANRWLLNFGSLFRPSSQNGNRHRLSASKPHEIEGQLAIPPVHLSLLHTGLPLHSMTYNA